MKILDIQKLQANEVYDELGTNDKGLLGSEAASRLERYGKNELQKKKAVPVWRKFLKQLTNFFALLLWVAAIMAFVGEALSPGEGMLNLGIALAAVVLINGTFTFYQEYKAEKAIEALQRMLAYNAVVIREGKEREISAGEIVPGDVIKLAEGNRVPADARLIEAYELKVNNSILTGESRPSKRNAEASEEDLIESENIVFSGTTVVAGTGVGVVYGTGSATEFGRIADMTSEIVESLTPLQKEISKFIKVISAIAIILGLAFFSIGIFIGNSFWVSFIFAIGIIVANVPEGLLPTVTLTLSLGSQRMARRNALIKSLNSVETLGSTTVICTDKTGTLTQNQMTVRAIYANGREYSVSGGGYEPKGDVLEEDNPVDVQGTESLNSLMRCGSLCNDASLSKEEDLWNIIGDPTEGAIKVLAAKSIDIEGLDKEHSRIFQVPFDSERKRMSVVVRSADGIVCYVKGAPESIISRSTRIIEDGGIRALDDGKIKELEARAQEFSDRALRVIALSYKTLDSEKPKYDKEELESDLIFIGLVGMIDPPRMEVREAIDKCKSAGIRIIIITGDNPQTAQAIAKATGVVEGEGCLAVTGKELNTMGDEELKSLLAQKEIIFARTTPEHKMRIVTTLKDMDEVVAVTGDGVNDAPALKAADIGIAMGISGTDVAKEAADMILVDDNFASIVNAIEEGRAVFANIRKFISYILTSNIPEIVPYIVYVLAGVPLPLTVIQILTVDLGTDLAPAIAIGAEPPEPGVMQQKPRSRTERLLKKSTLLRSYGFVGPIEAAAGLLAFFWLLQQGGWTGGDLPATDLLYQKATTICLTAIIVCQIANVFVVRSPRLSIFQQGFLSNKKILIGIAIELVLIMLFVYVPPIQAILGTQALGLKDWLFLAPFAVFLFVAEEFRKYVIRRRMARSAVGA
ncbi:MAG: cation-transporting P-type ATPase [Candidatus Methanofastidiosa archaeon]|nr:cation-transporting P-type ATPase [Candidatus Methanofastidiosa archaeon]